MNSKIRECVVCGLEVDTKKGAVIRHTIDHGCKVKSGIGHYSHALCLDPDSDLLCAACNDVPATVAAAAPNAQEQPRAPDGRDYVDFPVEQTRLGVLRKQWLSPLVNYNRHREDITDPVALVRLGAKVCPIPWLLKGKEIGLHHILQAGGLMDDFLNAGYKIGDLQHFQDLDPTGRTTLERRQRTLEAMGLTAEHLRDYREALPIAQMRADYGITPQFIHENLGLGVDRTEGFISWRHPAGGSGWKASDLTYLGFSYQHLCNMGLACREHWDQLQATQTDIQALGVSVDTINALPYVLATPPLQEKEEKDAPVAETLAAQLPPRRRLPFSLKRR